MNENDLNELTRMFAAFFKYTPLAFMCILVLCGLFDFIVNGNPEGLLLLAIGGVPLVILVPIGAYIGIFKK